MKSEELQLLDYSLQRNTNYESSISQTSYLSSFEESLNKLIPSNEQTKTQKIRHILGKGLEHYTDDEIEVLVSQFEYLIAGWLDEYEKNLFNGKTLKELLK